MAANESVLRSSLDPGESKLSAVLPETQVFLCVKHLTVYSCGPVHSGHQLCLWRYLTLSDSWGRCDAFDCFGDFSLKGDFHSILLMCTAKSDPRCIFGPL